MIERLKTPKNHVDELKKLKPQAGGQGRERMLSAEDGPEVIAAFRRGVSVDQIAATLGRGRGNIYAAVGTWALRHCTCGGNK